MICLVYPIWEVTLDRNLLFKKHVFYHDDIPDLAIDQLWPRKPTIVLAQQLVAGNFNVTSNWLKLWTESILADGRNLIDPVLNPDGFEQPRDIWSFIRIWISHIVWAYNFHKWENRYIACDDCSFPNQTIDSIVEEYELRAYKEAQNIFSLPNLRALNG